MPTRLESASWCGSTEHRPRHCGAQPQQEPLGAGRRTLGKEGATLPLLEAPTGSVTQLFIKQGRAASSFISNLRSKDRYSFVSSGLPDVTAFHYHLMAYFHVTFNQEVIKKNHVDKRNGKTRISSKTILASQPGFGAKHLLVVLCRQLIGIRIFRCHFDPLGQTSVQRSRSFSLSGTTAASRPGRPGFSASSFPSRSGARDKWCVCGGGAVNEVVYCLIPGREW